MNDVDIVVGDCRKVLTTLPDESVHCIITSPPYWGLRDYGTGTWVGGNANCDHQVPKTALGGGSNKGHDGSFTNGYRNVCRKCGAVRADQQLGLEGTPEEYVSNLVDIFSEARRVLRNDGVVWLNLGDTYYGSWGNYSGGNRGSGTQREITVGTSNPQKSYDGLESYRPASSRLHNSLKPKDLCGIPWRVALALQADGWWLRSDCIWHKPNPMPESIKDRPTKSHEYMFLLTKSSKYYYDYKSVKENTSLNDGKRNRRTVWTIPTRSFRGAHFATFPTDLVEPCVLAGSPEGGVVLDPFGGAGTVGLVSNRLGRNSVLIELNPEYAQMAKERIELDSGIFATVNIIQGVMD